MIGKPYSGKPNIRFDEGELEIEHMRGHYASSLLYWSLHAFSPENSFVKSAM